MRGCIHTYIRNSLTNLCKGVGWADSKVWDYYVVTYWDYVFPLDYAVPLAMETPLSVTVDGSTGGILGECNLDVCDARTVSRAFLRLVGLDVGTKLRTMRVNLRYLCSEGDVVTGSHKVGVSGAFVFVGFNEPILDFFRVVEVRDELMVFLMGMGKVQRGHETAHVLMLGDGVQGFGLGVGFGNHVNVIPYSLKNVK